MLKLGTQTASLHNHLYSRMTKGQPVPVVGMGATMLAWTDRNACTIIEVFQIGNDIAVKVQRDSAKRIDDNGMSEDQTYEYTADPQAPTYNYRFRNGTWEQVIFGEQTKRWKRIEGNGLRIGTRDSYHDFSF